MSVSLDGTICAYFVKNTKGDNTNSAAVDQLASALTLMREHLDASQIREIKPSEGYTLIAAGSLTKKDVFVLAVFEGNFFEQLQMTKALVLGPPCVLHCLTKCEPIPLGTSPVYTTAMRDVHISATGIPVDQKEQLSKLVLWMGGHYFQNFGRTITHLISNTIKSNKYEHATLSNVPVMHVDWVQCVWDRSCVDVDINATNTEFDKYRLPTFFGTNITCSGLESSVKDKIMRLVNENGGCYHRAFRSQQVDIVITEQSKTDSEKYKAAVRFKKDVLRPEWIFDSHERGYALPTKKYEVRPRKQVSTPTKQSGASNQTVADHTQLSDLSRISFVSGVARRMCSDVTTVNETISSLASSPVESNSGIPSASGSSKDLLKQATSSGAQHYQQTLAEICPSHAKKAGPFLDGCCVYLSGFRSEEREKLNRVLNTGGATRYDEANDGVTHIIVGQLEDAAYKQWQRDGLVGSVHIVRLDWLLESLKAGRIANESLYRVSLPQTREPDMASPASKRTLRSMNHSFKQPGLPIKKKLFDIKAKQTAESDEPEEQLLTHYSQEHEPAAKLPPTAAAMLANETHDAIMQPAASSTQVGGELIVAQPMPTDKLAEQAAALGDLSASVLSIDFDKLDYFMGASIYVHKESFNGEFYTQMLSECEAAQGNLVSQNFSDPVDYAIVSFEVAFDVSTLPVKARHVVTELYMESCMKQNKLLPLEYYHCHIPHQALNEPLKGMTVVVSIYAGLERDFINSIASLLGANVNKTFIKKEKPLLVCPSAEGSKYQGAIKWKYPVVNSAWLVECAERGEKLPYINHLVGKSATDFPDSPRLKERNQSKNQSSSSKTLTPAPNNNVTITPPISIEEIENQEASSVAVAAPMVPPPASPRHATPTTAEFTPLRNRRVSELAHPGAMTRSVSRRSSGGSGSASDHAAPDSPRTPLSQNGAAGGGYNFDFLEKFIQRLNSDEDRDCIREIIREMRENQTPELERMRRMAATPGNRRLQRPPPGIPDFCLTPEFQQRMADDFERRWRLPVHKISPDTPIEVIRKRVMRITCETLGIDYEDGDEAKPTKNVETKKASPAAKKTPVNKKISSTAKDLRSSYAAPLSPSTSSSSAQRMDTFTPLPGSHVRLRPGRTLFEDSPGTTSGGAIVHEASPNGSHFVPGTQSPGVAGAQSGLGRSTINFDKISFEETNQNTITAGAVTADGTTTLATNSPELKQLTDYLKNCASKRNSLKRSHSRAERVERSKHGEESYMESEVQFVQPFESEGFMLGTEEAVGWRDPAEFNAAKRRSTGSPRMQHKGTPCFSISSSDDEQKAELIEKIRKLGGEVCSNLINYDASCTHFICERPNRGEKMLGCMAAGKWVLYTKYIEESELRGAFIDEELYEWGNPKAQNQPTLAPEEQVIATAVHRWRVELSLSGGGAFSEHRVILSLQEKSKDAIKNVLRAGGGCILEPRSPFSTDPTAASATHCFVDAKRAPLAPRDFAYLKQIGVTIMQQMCINAYLMGGRNTDLERYELQQ
ncbi:DNA topoisomerase 2-binding protein 1 [Scaptodrosophila lebanonensis]|uniref:DNA topoisomerase 2-binding protein 1 n=1 Tax=Drosophila lebanonensis TaxID=7225 RepID=A0A6J2TT10_DROLE|nr:DNA topoisomerase 2-binding protein 1 [Scaptodrosophila lebanonensis]